MGITIHYRGTMDDVSQIETMEDRVLDHPAIEQAQSFLMQVLDLANDNSNQSSFIPGLIRASMNIVGGLVQATSDADNDTTHRALASTQLKRALSAHAHARGAVFGLRSEAAISQERSAQLPTISNPFSPRSTLSLNKPGRATLATSHERAPKSAKPMILPLKIETRAQRLDADAELTGKVVERKMLVWMVVMLSVRVADRAKN